MGGDAWLFWLLLPEGITEVIMQSAIEVIELNSNGIEVLSLIVNRN